MIINICYWLLQRILRERENISIEWVDDENATEKEQGRIHGYPSRVRVGRGRNWGHQIIWAGAVKPKIPKTQKS